MKKQKKSKKNIKIPKKLKSLKTLGKKIEKIERDEKIKKKMNISIHLSKTRTSHRKRNATKRGVRISDVSKTSTWLAPNERNESSDVQRVHPNLRSSTISYLEQVVRLSRTSVNQGPAVNRQPGFRREQSQSFKILKKSNIVKMGKK